MLRFGTRSVHHDPASTARSHTTSGESAKAEHRGR
jgi:hypothetical protein